MSNLMGLGSDVWNLVCGYTEIPPSGEEVHKNNKALSDMINNIYYSTLKITMCYTTDKYVMICWESMKEKQRNIFHKEN